MKTRYRITLHDHKDCGGYQTYHPYVRAWYTLGIWWPLTVGGELSQGDAQRHIDLHKGTIKPSGERVVHEETVP